MPASAATLLLCRLSILPEPATATLIIMGMLPCLLLLIAMKKR